MGTYTTAMRLSEIAVIAEDLKSILWESMGLEPPIYRSTPKPRVFPVGCAVIVSVVNTQKTPIVNTTTGAFTPIRLKHDSSKFGMCAPGDSFRRFGVFFAPCFRVGTIPLAMLVVMLDVIGMIALTLTSNFFLRVKFFAHNGMLP